MTSSEAPGSRPALTAADGDDVPAPPRRAGRNFWRLGEWRKSRRSTGASGNCVEIAPGFAVSGPETGAPSFIAIRDSKNPDAGMLTLNPSAWRQLRNEVHDNRYDLTPRDRKPR
ncbi:DUF397 domain-containing protein [Actinomadura barringtoniae]|uniref:DUF397 domain-containing protein n=1 Tax=Actinomadura barringtoniae TaxID=1427535 RepID=A0A939P875_9ACTN|nr:DUF397 domain-containing protein [Actinomadura barringtoniae]MBO2447717.1 DUF397 domain-containing protein [Actinomadura barringtoniae]